MKIPQLLIPGLIILSLSCQAPIKEDKAIQKPQVASVNYPLWYFTEKIAGDLVNNPFLPDSIGDPAYWTPGPETLVVFQQADIILLNGAEYARWAKTASLPKANIVNTSSKFEDRYIVETEGEAHRHGDGEAHQHMVTAITTWLDFDQAARQAEAVKDVLAKAIPTQEKLLEENYLFLKKELETLDSAMRSFTKNETVATSRQYR